MKFEEIELIKKLQKPIIPFSMIEKKLDENAKKLGYENHTDFLHKTGWHNRFNTKSDYCDNQT